MNVIFRNFIVGTTAICAAEILTNMYLAIPRLDALDETIY